MALQRGSATIAAQSARTVATPLQRRGKDRLHGCSHPGRRRRPAPGGRPPPAARVRGAARPGEGAPAAGPQRRRANGGAALRQRPHGPVDPRGLARRPYDLADQAGVRPARPVPRASAPGPAPVDDPRAGLGLRLRPRLERARGVRRLPAPQARDRRRAAGDPHRPRGRLRAPRGPRGGTVTGGGTTLMSFRARLTLAYLALLTLTLSAFGFGVYAYVDAKLHHEFESAFLTQGRALGQLLQGYSSVNTNGVRSFMQQVRPSTYYVVTARRTPRDPYYPDVNVRSQELTGTDVNLPGIPADRKVHTVPERQNELATALAVYSADFEAVEPPASPQGGGRAQSDTT